MITLNNQIRLSQKERKQLPTLVGSDVKHIKTPTQLNNYVGAHLMNYPGRCPEEKLMRMMLESFLIK